MQLSRGKRSYPGDRNDSSPDRRFRRVSWGEKETDLPPDLQRRPMSLPAAYQSLIDALTEHVRRDPPDDILQFCADFFLARLAAERQSHHIAATVKSEPTELPPLPIIDESKRENMSSAFTSPFGANANPFGGGSARADSGSGMQQVIEEEEGDTVASPSNPSFGTQPSAPGFRAPFGGGDAATDGGPTSLHGAQHSGSYPTQYNFGRRTSVSAESLKPVADGSDNWQPPVHQKTSEQLERLKAAIQDNFLFSHLDDEQSSQVLGALVEKPIPAKDIKVITQGDAGDYFYVVERGSFDVFVNPAGSLQPGPDGLGKKVGTIAAGGSFGELALMYNAPRAATVMSAEPNCLLWALDRVTFRRIVMESTYERRRMYESFLEEVPLLSSLTPYERSKIADALETQKFPPGSKIIKEGDPGYSFYLLEAGEADAFKEGNSESVKHYAKGDFFGELALLNDAPRAASVVSKTEVKVATLGKSAFQRLLGPVEGIMRRTKYEGVKSGVEEMDPLQKHG